MADLLDLPAFDGLPLSRVHSYWRGSLIPSLSSAAPTAAAWSPVRPESPVTLGPSQPLIASTVRDGPGPLVE